MLATLGLAALLQGAAVVADTAVAPPPVPAPAASLLVPAAADTTPRRRPRAIEVSDAYATRLQIHKLASYPVIPLFVLQSVAGNQLYVADANGSPRPGWAKSAHSLGAGALGALFTINTVTGVWNAWDSRDVTQGRTTRLLHSALMLASDAGFTYAGIALSGDAQRNADTRNQHRRIAYISMGTTLAGLGVILAGNR